MKQKERFIRMWQSNDFTVTALCKSFGISRTTGYKLINEFSVIGEACFAPKSKKPKTSPQRTSEVIEQKIIELRKKHETWGARKFRKMLQKYFKENLIPSETTINAILKRNNLVKNRRKRSGKLGKPYPMFDLKECNEIWSADYKRKLKLKNGRYCHPLTICDSRNRMILGVECLYRPNYVSVKHAYTKAFREYGLPYFIHIDNGSPFGNTQAFCRFTKLSYWLIDQGVKPVYSDPASPLQNGRHERMHKDLKAYNRIRMERT